MEIYEMTCGHPLWDKTITFAENCSWKAGSYLAKRMRNNILSGEIGLYEKYGFEKISDEETVYGTVDQLFQKRLV